MLLLVGSLLPLACERTAQPAAPLDHAPAEQRTSSGQPHPNLIIWLVDTLRADHLGCYGYTRPTSPRLDALAASSVLFESAHANSNWTLPSVTSLLSGRYPPVFGADFDVAIPDSTVLAAQWFSGHGYQTAGMTMTLATAAVFGFDRGFDSYTELDAQTSEFARRMRFGPDFDADRLVDAALHWLDSDRDPARPFLLHLHSVDPHVPYESHGANSFAKEGYSGTIDGRTETLRDAFASGYQFTPADVRHVIDLYDDELRFSDQQLGRLLDALVERGLFDDTLLVVVSDHGEELWDRHSQGHGHRNLHAELTHVPLVLSWPAGLPHGLRMDGLMRGIDLLPTLIELAGLPALPDIDGSSVARLVRASGSLTGRGITLHALRAKQPLDVTALRTERWLYHADPQGTTSGLYDLRADPGELHDLRRELPERKQQSHRELYDWLRLWGRRTEEQHASRRTLELAPEDQQALRALGYLGDDG